MLLGMAVGTGALLLALLLGGTALVVALLRQREGGLPTRAVFARRRLAWLWAAALAGGTLCAVFLLVLAQSLTRSTKGGVVLALAPLAGAAVGVIVLFCGEVLWPRPSGQRRRAGLVRRSVTTVTPRPIAAAAVVVSVAFVALVVACAVAAGPDGHSLTRVRGPVTTTAGPFRGLYYGERALEVWLGLACLTAVVLVLVVHRPVVTEDDAQLDVALRRISAHRVLRIYCAGTGAALVGFAYVASSALRSVELDGWARSTLVLSGLALVGTVVTCVWPVMTPVAALRDRHEPAGSVTGDARQRTGIDG